MYFSEIIYFVLLSLLIHLYHSSAMCYINYILNTDLILLKQFRFCWRSCHNSIDTWWTSDVSDVPLYLHCMQVPLFLRWCSSPSLAAVLRFSWFDKVPCLFVWCVLLWSGRLLSVRLLFDLVVGLLVTTADCAIFLPSDEERVLLGVPIACNSRLLSRLILSLSRQCWLSFIVICNFSTGCLDFFDRKSSSFYFLVA